MSKSKTAASKSDDTKKVNTSLRLDRKTLKALKTQAIADDTSVQKIIEKLVDGFLEKAGTRKS